MLAERLSALYTERADLSERIERMKTDPVALAQVNASLHASRQQFLSAEEILRNTVSAGALALLRLQEALDEKKWIEAQILAILGNPALASAALDVVTPT